MLGHEDPNEIHKTVHFMTGFRQVWGGGVRLVLLEVAFLYRDLSPLYDDISGYTFWAREVSSTLTGDADFDHSVEVYPWGDTLEL